MRARRENQPKITPRGLPERAVRRIVDFFAPGGDSASNLVVSRCLRTLPGTLFGSPGCPWGAFGRCRATFGPPSGRAGDAPRRSWVPPGRPGELREVPRAIWGRFGVPRGASRDRFGLDFGSVDSPPRLTWGGLLVSFVPWVPPVIKTKKSNAMTLFDFWHSHLPLSPEPLHLQTSKLPTWAWVVGPHLGPAGWAKPK